jgi:hypothetical protein
MLLKHNKIMELIMEQRKLYRTLTKVLSGLAIGTMLVGCHLIHRELENYEQKQEVSWNKLERAFEPEPRRITPLLQDVIAYRLDENRNKRNFIDEVPFGTLDEVVILRDKRVEIKPGNPEFDEQQRIYQEKIRPLYMGK